MTRENCLSNQAQRGLGKRWEPRIFQAMRTSSEAKGGRYVFSLGQVIEEREHVEACVRDFVEDNRVCVYHYSSRVESENTLGRVEGERATGNRSQFLAIKTSGGS